MFKGILIDKDDSGYRAALQEIQDDQLSEGDVTVRVAYSTLNFKSKPADTRTTRSVTRSCSMAGAWAKGIGVDWRRRRA
jgi:acrylyl-CoA reductase (NADPH)